jgi:NAD(P)-dependent dehydrogenase (short-subunit alcohol dehydrogenase family)
MAHFDLEVAADVTSREDRHRIVESVEREFGRVDVLVNNAGGAPQREFHNLGEEEIEGVIELNLTSAILLTRLVLPGMLAREHGHIVNISSMAGRTSFPFTEAYAAGKDGLIGFTRVLRGDYRSHGVSGSTLILGPGKRREYPMTRPAPNHDAGEELLAREIRAGVREG